MPKDIFLLGLLDWQREVLESVHHRDDYRFHSLLEFDELVANPPGFDALLDRARRELKGSGVKPAAILCHWDFPSSCLAPVLSKELGLRAPTLESVLRCEHKYWARLEQRKVVPECVPAFQAMDPFEEGVEDTLQIDYPIWVKPVKSHSSILGFHVRNRKELRAALAETRQYIGKFRKSFDECLRHADLPGEIEGIGGRHVLAEQIMQGDQFAFEGSIGSNRRCVHGFLDMIRGQDGKDIQALWYPSTMSEEIQKQSEAVAWKVLQQAGFDNGCFNAEFLWDKEREKLWLIEINARMSQSHSDMFRKVDGLSNHDVALNVAIGNPPEVIHGKGPYRMSAKFLLNKIDDADVLRAPTPEELALVAEELGNAIIVVDAHKGMRLSTLIGQAQYRYTVGEAWVGGNSSEELIGKYHHLISRLPFEFSDGLGLHPADLSRVAVEPPVHVDSNVAGELKRISRENRVHGSGLGMGSG